VHVSCKKSNSDTNTSSLLAWLSTFTLFCFVYSHEKHVERSSL
jgi:hypothetical protein